MHHVMIIHLTRYLVIYENFNYGNDEEEEIKSGGKLKEVIFFFCADNRKKDRG